MKSFYLVLFLYFSVSISFFCTPLHPSLAFQPWRNLEAIPPLRRSGSHLTRSITLCLFQLKLTPFAVKSTVMPCRKVTRPLQHPLPRGFKCFWMYILCCYKKIYTVRWRSKGWTSKALPAGKCVLGVRK